MGVRGIGLPPPFVKSYLPRQQDLIMILVIDNYDSFTFNLVQLLGPLSDLPIRVIRNDQFLLQEVLAWPLKYVVISPGPGRPDDAGITLDLIRASPSSPCPLLGVCLGHQALGQVFGAEVIHSPEPRHGKCSQVRHNNQGVFSGLPSPYRAMRYHSLALDRRTLGPELEICAESDDDVIMGIRHKTRPLYGVQFHPESFMTEYGKELMKNFLEGA